ncbi:MAG: hypothetical protein LBQ90_12715 [Synergistaceae bacterium]|jgi:hypothetical protein|nr:hypothetical protein [Synergistaceae bacterium]
MTEERKQTFWGWISENPISAVMILITILGVVALVVGYREGFMAILTGLFGKLNGDDNDNKRRLEEARKKADSQFDRLDHLAETAKEQQISHDEEVVANVENAKAECDEMDIDELVDVGNAMLADHGAFRGET